MINVTTKGEIKIKIFKVAVVMKHTTIIVTMRRGIEIFGVTVVKVCCGLSVNNLIYLKVRRFETYLGKKSLVLTIF